MWSLRQISISYFANNRCFDLSLAELIIYLYTASSLVAFYFRTFKFNPVMHIAQSSLILMYLRLPIMHLNSFSSPALISISTVYASNFSSAWYYRALGIIKSLRRRQYLYICLCAYGLFTYLVGSILNYINNRQFI